MAVTVFSYRYLYKRTVTKAQTHLMIDGWVGGSDN
jgi:hypothetical protein